MLLPDTQTVKNFKYTIQRDFVWHAQSLNYIPNIQINFFARLKAPSLHSTFSLQNNSTRQTAPAFTHFGYHNGTPQSLLAPHPSKRDQSMQPDSNDTTAAACSTHSNVYLANWMLERNTQAGFKPCGLFVLLHYRSLCAASVNSRTSNLNALWLHSCKVVQNFNILKVLELTTLSVLNRVVQIFFGQK